MGIPAYGYWRVSGSGQVDGYGPERQEETIRAFAKANDYEIVKCFGEHVSGTTGEDERPGFEAMVTEILKDGIHTVIVESLDRLAREYRIQEQLLFYLASKGIDLIAANTGENVTKAVQDDPMKKAMVQMQGIFSELDKSLLVRKLRNARAKVKAESGKCEGRKAYGEGSEKEAAVVRRIKLMRRRRKGGLPGMTLQQIADRLNAEGIPTKTGKKWYPAQVSAVVKRK